MFQIPKNVMQIGTVNPHTKIYMEDYVHTFLERHKNAEEYLAFGKKEERGDVLYYLLYGVEKRTDWERGSYPYFKKYERIGTIEGPAQKRVFRPVRGSGITMDGYFIFYEQNEDMQSYMIVVNESEDAAGSEEKEAVMEAVRTHKEQRRKELETDGAGKGAQAETAVSASARAAGSVRGRNNGGSTAGILQTLQRKAKKNAAAAMGRTGLLGGTGKKSRMRRVYSAPSPKTRTWTIPDLCRAGSMVLLLVLVVMGLTSINQYPDMKAVTELFFGAAEELGNQDGDAVPVGANLSGDELTVEEMTVGQDESADVAEAFMDETDGAYDLALAEDGNETVQWMIGQQTETGPAEKTSAEASSPADTEGTVETSAKAPEETAMTAQSGEIAAEPQEKDATAPAGETEEESVTQAIARPVSYVVKKGDSLAGIARKFYGNASMVREICDVNQIENPDQIHPGQNILLP